jgi:hypothetical protein
MPRATWSWECDPLHDQDAAVVLSAGPEAVHVDCDPETLDACLPRSGPVGFNAHPARTRD